VARGLTGKKHPKGDKFLPRPRRCLWVTLRVEKNNVYAFAHNHIYMHREREKERERENKERRMSIGIHACIHKNDDFFIFFAKLKDKRIFFSKTIDFRKKLLGTKMS